jgi:hypothetical protein
MNTATFDAANFILAAYGIAGVGLLLITLRTLWRYRYWRKAVAKLDKA